MRNENENQAMKCECTEACNCTPCDTEACNCTPCNPYEATVHLMLSPDYKARFVAEYRQTKIRYERLKKFCNRIEAAHRSGGKLDMPKHDCDLGLLIEQLNAMRDYLHVLEIRAEIEHIDL